MINQKTLSVTLNQFEGGDIVKQGDTSSVFGYQFVDENGKPIELDGKIATIRLHKKDFTVVYETKETVKGDRVEFTINEPIQLGKHFVEIWAGGYVFPSDDEIKLEVTRSTTDYTPEQLFNADQLSRIIELEEKLENISITGGSKPFVFNQSTPSSVWIINHNLGRYPDPVVLDSAGTMVHGAVQYNDLNTLTITFNAAFSGTAELD